MAPSLDPLTAAALAWQLASSEPPVGCTSQVQFSPSFNVRAGAPLAAQPGGHGTGHSHPPHAPGSRLAAATSSTSGTILSYTIAFADTAEYVKDVASDTIVDDLVFIGGQLYRVLRLR